MNRFYKDIKKKKYKINQLTFTGDAWHKDLPKRAFNKGNAIILCLSKINNNNFYWNQFNIIFRNNFF